MIWPHFTKDNPCPACGHWDWACRAGDRAFVCMRVASDRPAKDGGFYHFYDGEKPLKLPPKRFSPPKRTTVPEIKIKTCGEDLARDLGVSMSALRTLGVGWSDAYGAWMFPMKNGRGEIVGWNRRYKTGEKKIVAGTKSGLYLPDMEPFGIPFVCEGGSDTAALLDLGLFGIGRFNCLSGADELKEFFKLNSIYKCVIVADNDTPKLRNGIHIRPGTDGAIRLKEKLGVQSVVWQPPSPCKDVREFKSSGGTAELIWSGIKTKIWSRK